VGRKHFHTLCRDAPLSLTYVEFLPGGATQLTGPDESHYDEPQGQLRDRIAGIGSELLQEVRQLSPGHRGTVLHIAGLQDPLHIRRRVVGRPAGLDGVAENGADPLQDPGRDIEGTPGLHRPDDLQDHRRGDLLYRQVAQSGEDVRLQGVHHPVTV